MLDMTTKIIDDFPCAFILGGLFLSTERLTAYKGSDKRQSRLAQYKNSSCVPEITSSRNSAIEGVPGAPTKNIQQDRQAHSGRTCLQWYALITAVAACHKLK
jgi:hypothetical protein